MNIKEALDNIEQKANELNEGDIPTQDYEYIINNVEAARGDVCEKLNRNKPWKLDTFMYGLMKEARKDSFADFLESWDIEEEEYKEIKEWFNKRFKVEL
ncbi:hypothetical protein AAXE64_08220 [Priestia megaterium]